MRKLNWTNKCERVT